MKKIILIGLIVSLIVLSGCDNKIYGEFNKGVILEEGFKDWENGCMKVGGEFKWTYPNNTMICTRGEDSAIFIYKGNNQWEGYDI